MGGLSAGGSFQVGAICLVKEVSLQGSARGSNCLKKVVTGGETERLQR